MKGFELVRLRPDDVLDEWQSWFDSPHTKHYTRSGRQLSVNELRESARRTDQTSGPITLGIRDSQAERFIGTVKIGPVDVHHGLADLAVLIGDAKYLGRGLAAAFVEDASAWAFEHLGIRKLHSGILEHNVASIKAYTRAGWIVEGVLKQHYVNGGVAQDWILISKFNPSMLSGNVAEGHAVDLRSILKIK